MHARMNSQLRMVHVHPQPVDNDSSKISAAGLVDV